MYFKELAKGWNVAGSSSAFLAVTRPWVGSLALKNKQANKKQQQNPK
jgi:hypothetical protein